ncbi:MAG: GrpB family protein [Bacilli bacterium]|jgi:GrpB-like predicted nucleotidyltransferase (UPF0157 family)|nr:GrpB family protein [Bacilli bacterium]
MKKELSEMTLKELWDLFPVFLVPPNPNWKRQYEDEEKNLLSFLPPMEAIRISHIGSTAIKQIWAKPIVDILVEIPSSVSMDLLKDALLAHGYLCMAESGGRKDFNKGYTKDGFADKVFHLHLRFFGDNDELYFRDYLNGDSKKAKEYEKLKLSLWRRFEHDRDGYTDAKGGFVARTTALAKRKYKGRYDLSLR